MVLELHSLFRRHGIEPSGALVSEALKWKTKTAEMVVVCPHRYDRRLSTAELSREVLHEVVGD